MTHVAFATSVPARVQRVTDSGLIVSQRSLIPGSEPVVPNDNAPADVPPSTVGPPSATPGDPNGLDVVEVGEPAPWPRSVVRPSRWAGYPAEWDVPLWGGRTTDLTDTAWACIDLNARVVSIMPPYLVGAATSLNADWLNNPDPDIYNSWIDFAKQLLWDYLLGEAFVLVTARYDNGNGYPARFHVVAPWLVDVDMVAGMRRYRIGDENVTGDIIHVPYQIRTDEPHGHGPLEAGALRLVAARMLARYAFNMVAGGGLPVGVLEYPDELTAQQSAELQHQWVEARMASMGLPAVVSGGVTFTAAAYSPEQLTLMDLSRWNESRISVLLGVPPFLVGLPSGGDSMTYSNVSQVFDYHWRAGLSTFATTCMAALSFHLLPRGTAVEVNRDEYVKADPLSRAQMWAIYNDMGLAWDQIAEAERFDANAAPAPPLTSGVLK